MSKEPQQEQGSERETINEEVNLSEMAKKQGHMTDEEFQSLLEGVQLLEQEPTRVAEKLDLTPRVVDEGEKQTVVTTEETNQPGEEPISGEARDEEEIENPKTAKRKLALKEDKQNANSKPKCSPKRRVTQGIARKIETEENVAPVEISS